MSLACSLLVGLWGCAWWVPVACGGIQMLLAWPVLLRKGKPRGAVWWLAPLGVMGGAVVLTNACGYAATCGPAPSFGPMAGVSVAAFVCYAVAALVLVIGRAHGAAAAAEDRALLSVNQV